KKGKDPEAQARHALADRIEDNLTTLLGRVEQILRENRNHVLALAHALETHKTLSGEDIVAVMEHTVGPLVDGRPSSDQAFLDSPNANRLSPARAHQDHSQGQRKLPAPVPAPASVPSWAEVVVADDPPPGLNGHNPEGS